MQEHRPGSRGPLLARSPAQGGHCLGIGQLGQPFGGCLTLGLGAVERLDGDPPGILRTQEGAGQESALLRSTYRDPGGLGEDALGRLWHMCQHLQGLDRGGGLPQALRDPLRMLDCP